MNLINEYKPILLLIFISVSLFGFFISCNNSDKSKTIEIIDLVIAYENRQKINLSDIVESIEYVQLSNKDSLIGIVPRVFVDSQYVVVIAFKQQFLFSRKTGAFIRQVGYMGRGPNGYRNTKFNLPFNESKKSIYANSWNRGIVEYSINGKANRILKKISNEGRLNSFAWLNDSVYVAHVKNFIGNEKTKLVFFNINNDEYSTFPNSDFFEKNPKMYRSWAEKEGWFYRYNNKLFIKELFNDTIFEIRNRQMFAKFEFYSGKFKPSSFRRNFITKDEMKNYHLVENIFESSGFIFFTLNYRNELRSGLYYKRKKVAFVSDSKISYMPANNTLCFGLTNDIDNFIQFCPQYKNSNNELIAFVEAYKVVSWFKNNPEKTINLPPHLQKLKDIKETDNPIVMIAKLKE